MQDPGNIRNIPINYQKNITLELREIPEFECEAYDLNDEKDFEKYIKDIEKCVRSSIEYRRFTEYLRTYMDMDRCSFIANAKKDHDNNIKIEIHHYPFTLYDICRIVYNKRMYNNESLEWTMVAKEVMQLHYELLVGLIPLSKTVHKLAHNEWIFIPVNNVLGNWNHFYAVYKDYMGPDQADVLQRIIEFSESYDKERNEEILMQNNIYLSTQNPEYQIPDLRQTYVDMKNRISIIKSNYYQLPEVTEEEYEQKKLEVKRERQELENPWIYIGETY